MFVEQWNPLLLLEFLDLFSKVFVLSDSELSAGWVIQAGRIWFRWASV